MQSQIYIGNRFIGLSEKCDDKRAAEQRARTGEPSRGEPRGRFGGVRGKQPLASSPPSANRTPNLARRLENLTAFDFQCCERPLGSIRLPPPLLRKPVRVRGSARRYTNTTSSCKCVSLKFLLCLLLSNRTVIQP